VLAFLAMPETVQYDQQDRGGFHDGAGFLTR
jgi:hypothetical protein